MHTCQTLYLPISWVKSKKYVCSSTNVVVLVVFSTRVVFKWAYFPVFSFQVMANFYFNQNFKCNFISVTLWISGCFFLYLYTFINEIMVSVCRVLVQLNPQQTIIMMLVMVFRVTFFVLHNTWFYGIVYDSLLLALDWSRDIVHVCYNYSK